MKAACDSVALIGKGEKKSWEKERERRVEKGSHNIHSLPLLPLLPHLLPLTLAKQRYFRTTTKRNAGVEEIGWKRERIIEDKNYETCHIRRA